MTAVKAFTTAALAIFLAGITPALRGEEGPQLSTGLSAPVRDIAVHITPVADEGGASIAEPVTVLNGQNGKARVFVGDNRLMFDQDGGRELAISEAFSTATTDWRPTGDINCSWSPDGKFLAVFIPHPRVTVIAVVDLVRQEVLNEFFSPDRQYPSWYGHVFSTKDTALEWQGDKLSIQTDVVTGSGEKKRMNRVLSITGSTFQVLTTDN